MKVIMALDGKGYRINQREVQKMDKETLKKGTRIYYNGDMANEEGKGVITDQRTSQFGTVVDIKMDDGRTFPSLSVVIFSDKYLGHGGTRFVTEEAYNLFRQEATDRIMEELEKGKEKKKMALTETEMRKVGAEYHKKKKAVTDDELDAMLEDASREAEKRGESDVEPKKEKIMIDIKKIIKLKNLVVKAIEITEEDKKAYEGDDEAHPALQYRLGMLHCQKDILDRLNDLIIQG